MSVIVIDADIMRSAGFSEHPHSSNARMILEAIQESGHSMLHCKPLKAEYDKHQSKFARVWRIQMFSKRQVSKWPYQENGELRRTLIEALPADKVNAETAVRKDAHLLEAAMASDQRIVSKDATARRLFQFACTVKGDHRSLLWADATEKPTEVIEWIKNGCEDQNEWRLCPSPPKPARKKAKR